MRSGRTLNNCRVDCDRELLLSIDPVIRTANRGRGVTSWRIITEIVKRAMKSSGPRATAELTIGERSLGTEPTESWDPIKPGIPAAASVLLLLPLLLSRTTFGQEWFFAINNCTVYARIAFLCSARRFALSSPSPRTPHAGGVRCCNYICTRRCKAFRILFETEFHRFRPREIFQRRARKVLCRAKKSLWKVRDISRRRLFTLDHTHCERWRYNTEGIIVPSYIITLPVGIFW